MCVYYTYIYIAHHQNQKLLCIKGCYQESETTPHRMEENIYKLSEGQGLVSKNLQIPHA